MIGKAKLKVLVAGSGKANFIARLLDSYPSSAEARRKNATTYFLYWSDKDLKIELHDVSDVKSIDRNFLLKMDAVFLCYAANDPEGFRNLEKWISLMAVKKEEMDSSQTKKTTNSFLVADLTNLGSQRDVTDSLSQKAKKLKEIYGINWFIESSFEDEKSASSAFRTIFNEVISLKLEEKSSFDNVQIKSSVKSDPYLREIFDCGMSEPHLHNFSSPSFTSCVDRDREEIFSLEKLFCKSMALGSFVA